MIMMAEIPFTVGKTSTSSYQVYTGTMGYKNMELTWNCISNLEEGRNKEVSMQDLSFMNTTKS